LASCGGKVASAVALLVADGFFTLAIDKPIKKGKVEIKCSLKNNNQNLHDLCYLIKYNVAPL
jgi:ethanolamine ammonia-lyase small subunit